MTVVTEIALEARSRLIKGVREIVPGRSGGIWTRDSRNSNGGVERASSRCAAAAFRRGFAAAAVGFPALIQAISKSARGGLAAAALKRRCVGSQIPSEIYGK